LKSKEFQEWINHPKQTLFCPGIPGAGKTIITSIVIDHLRTKFCDGNSIGVTYLYCHYKQKQELADFFASLLKQLIQEQASLPRSMMALYKHCKNKQTRPSLNEILSVLYSVVADYSKAFIIIDALDECQVSSGDRRRLLSEIFDIQTKSGVNLFVTSRFIPDIKDEFERRGSSLLEIRATDEDVRRYLDDHISQLPSFVLRSLELQENIKTRILKAVDGMYVAFLFTVVHRAF